MNLEPKNGVASLNVHRDNSWYSYCIPKTDKNALILLNEGPQTINGVQTFTESTNFENSAHFKGNVTFEVVPDLPNNVSIGDLSQISNSKGASINNNVLSLCPADETNPGLVTTQDQKISGKKTFSSILQLEEGAVFNASSTDPASLTTSIASQSTNGENISFFVQFSVKINNGGTQKTYVKNGNTVNCKAGSLIHLQWDYPNMVTSTNFVEATADIYRVSGNDTFLGFSSDVASYNTRELYMNVTNSSNLVESKAEASIDAPDGLKSLEINSRAFSGYGNTLNVYGNQQNFGNLTLIGNLTSSNLSVSNVLSSLNGNFTGVINSLNSNIQGTLNALNSVISSLSIGTSLLLPTSGGVKGNLNYYEKSKQIQYALTSLPTNSAVKFGSSDNMVMAKMTRIGNICVLTLPNLNLSTSNSTKIILTPSSLANFIPSSEVGRSCLVSVGGVIESACLFMDINGSIKITPSRELQFQDSVDDFNLLGSVISYETLSS